MSGAYARRFGNDSLRVLFVVAGRKPRARIERLKRWCEAEGGRSLFWFADKDAVDRSHVLCDPIWMVGGSARREALLPGAQPPLAQTTLRLPVVR